MFVSTVVQHVITVLEAQCSFDESFSARFRQNGALLPPLVLYVPDMLLLCAAVICKWKNVRGSKGA